MGSKKIVTGSFVRFQMGSGLSHIFRRRRTGIRRDGFVRYEFAYDGGALIRPNALSSLSVEKRGKWLEKNCWYGDLATRLEYDEHTITEFDEYGRKVKVTAVPEKPDVGLRFLKLRRKYSGHGHSVCAVCGHCRYHRSGW